MGDTPSPKDELLPSDLIKIRKYVIHSFIFPLKKLIESNGINILIIINMTVRRLEGLTDKKLGVAYQILMSIMAYITGGSRS